MLHAKNLAVRLTASDYLRKSFGLYVFCGPSRRLFRIVRVTKREEELAKMGDGGFGDSPRRLPTLNSDEHLSCLSDALFLGDHFD